jgi:hypothetical protein
LENLKKSGKSGKCQNFDFSSLTVFCTGANFKLVKNLLKDNFSSDNLNIEKSEDFDSESEKLSFLEIVKKHFSAYLESKELSKAQKWITKIEDHQIFTIWEQIRSKVARVEEGKKIDLFECFKFVKYDLLEDE